MGFVIECHNTDLLPTKEKPRQCNYISGASSLIAATGVYLSVPDLLQPRREGIELLLGAELKARAGGDFDLNCIVTLGVETFHNDGRVCIDHDERVIVEGECLHEGGRGGVVENGNVVTIAILISTNLNNMVIASCFAGSYDDVGFAGEV